MIGEKRLTVTAKQCLMTLLSTALGFLAAATAPAAMIGATHSAACWMLRRLVYRRQEETSRV